MAEPVPLPIPPGVVKDITRYSAKGRWIDSNRIRFIEGFVQPIGGWTKAISDTVVGTSRSLFAWADSDGNKYNGIGTNKKFYVESGGSISDITPIRKTTSPLGTDPIDSTAASGIVTINDTAHGANVGDYVTISGATTFDDLTTGELNQEFVILTVPDANSYTVDTGGAASSGASGGGASVVAAYQLNIGSNSTVLGTGWGSGSYSRSGYGSPYSISFVNQLRQWSQDQFDDLLVANPRGGAIYFYDPGSPARLADISTLSGAVSTPSVASQILIDGDAKHAIAFATNPYGTSTADQKTYRICSNANLADWDPTSTTNTAVENSFGRGSLFMGAILGNGEIIAFTDTSVYALAYQGPPDIYSQRHLTADHPIMAMKTMAASGSFVYWWGKRGIFRYGGTIQEVPCPVLEFAYNDIDPDQTDKSYGLFDPIFGEVWFFYQSTSSTTGDVDKYIKYNEKLDCWDVGSLNRTAYIPKGVLSGPRAIDENGQLFDHESGIDDASGSSIVSLGSNISSGPVEAGNGKKAQRVKWFWPDVDFTKSTIPSPSLDLTLTFRNRPGNATHSTYTGTITGDGSDYTDKLDVGKRGRTMEMEFSTGEAGSFWKIGINRVTISDAGNR